MKLEGCKQLLPFGGGYKEELQMAFIQQSDLLLIISNENSYMNEVCSVELIFFSQSSCNET